jgi:hypothetical protein
MDKTYPVFLMTKSAAAAACGSLTQTSKMPCKSYSLPVVACITGFKMAQIPDSICSHCYAAKGFYRMYSATVEPAQFARLDSLESTPAEIWVSGIVAMIGADTYFRWLDSGDIQSVDMLRRIALVCLATPHTSHWLPTREYALVKQYLTKYGELPANLTIRLSAMYFDEQVKVPASLQNVEGIEVSNAHRTGGAIGFQCEAKTRGGKCGECRHCFHRTGPVSYPFH